MLSPDGLLNSRYIESFIRSEKLGASLNSIVHKKRSQSFPKSQSEIRQETRAVVQSISNVANSLFKIIQNTAANGQCSLRIDDFQRSEVSHYYSLPSLEDCESFFRILKQLFAEHMGIDIVSNGLEWTISWNVNNPHLSFKPPCEIPAPFPEMQKMYFKNALEKGPFDVSFLCGDKVINANSFILRQSEFFEALIRKAGEIKTISLNDFSYEVYKAGIYFIYTGELEEGMTKNSKVLFQLFDLGDYIQFEPLKKYCKALLLEMINEKNFLLFAFYQNKFNDDQFFDLCQWFISKNYSYGQNIDISHFTPEQLMETYQVCRKFNASALEKNCLNLLLDYLKLDLELDEFWEICHLLSDEDLKPWLQQRIQAVNSKLGV